MAKRKKAHTDAQADLSDSEGLEGVEPLAESEEVDSGPENASMVIPDPFDPESLRIDGSDYMEQAGLGEEFVEISVRKPSKEWWIRTHPDESYRLKTGLLTIKEDVGGEQTYLVLPPLWPVMAAREESCFAVKLLVATITREGNPFLWPIKAPTPDGRLDRWNSSALHIAAEARTRWVRITSSRQIGQYKMQTTKVEIPDPDWSKVRSMRDMLQRAFSDCTINTEDHPVLGKLWGKS